MSQSGYTPIQLYYSTTASNTPSTSNLKLGELAFNIADNKIYALNATSSGIQTVVGTLGNQNKNSVSITGGAIDGTTVGATTASSGAFTTLTASTAIGVASGGTGLSTTPANGALDIGNGTGFTRTTLTAGTGVSITNGSGSITIATNGTFSTSAPVTITSNYTVGSTDSWIINNGSGSITLTLPTASSYTGRVLTVQNYVSQTVVSASSNVIPQGGGSAATAILTNEIGNWATLVSNGTNWVIMQAAAFNNLLLEG